MTHLNLVNISLVDQAPLAGTSLGDASLLFTHITRVLERAVILVLADELKKDANLGRLFSAQRPLDAGGYEVELGLILPGWLPNPPDAQDWIVTTSSESDPSSSIKLCFSNQMLRVRYQSPEGVRQAIVPSFAVAKAVELGHIPKDCPPEVLRTMVSARFHLPGDDAEAALEQGLDTVADRFVGAINKVIDGHLLMATPERPLLFFAVDRSSVEYLYLLVRGSDDAPIGVHRVALSMYRAIRVPGAYTPEEHAAFLRHVADVSGERLAHRFLSAGLTSIESGLLEVALLQLVIAGELGTSHAASALLAAHDVSRTKRDRYGRDLTYSELLNIVLVGLSPVGLKPAPDVIGTLNWGREARNDLMHQGLFSASRDQLRALFRATSLHLDYLDKVKPPGGEGVLEKKAEAPKEASVTDSAPQRSSGEMPPPPRTVFRRMPGWRLTASHVSALALGAVVGFLLFGRYGGPTDRPKMRIEFTPGGDLLGAISWDPPNRPAMKFPGLDEANGVGRFVPSDPGFEVFSYQVRVRVRKPGPHHGAIHRVHVKFVLFDKGGFQLQSLSGPPDQLISGEAQELFGTCLPKVSKALADRARSALAELAVGECLTCDPVR